MEMVWVGRKGGEGILNKRFEVKKLPNGRWIVLDLKTGQTSSKWNAKGFLTARTARQHAEFLMQQTNSLKRSQRYRRNKLRAEANKE